jgi:hypothetical protein
MSVYQGNAMRPGRKKITYYVPDSHTTHSLTYSKSLLKYHYLCDAFLNYILFKVLLLSYRLFPFPDLKIP